MSHSHVCCLVHVVFSTAERRPEIPEEMQERLHAYLGGIARENEISTLAVGGAVDHVHLLLSLPRTVSVAKAVQLLKSGSSKWIHENFPRSRNFSWQEGYGAFSIGVSQRATTVRYKHKPNITSGSPSQKSSRNSFPYMEWRKNSIVSKERNLLVRPTQDYVKRQEYRLN
jgi:putative transposase